MYPNEEAKEAVEERESGDLKDPETNQVIQCVRTDEIAKLLVLF